MVSSSAIASLSAARASSIGVEPRTLAEQMTVRSAALRKLASMMDSPILIVDSLCRLRSAQRVWVSSRCLAQPVINRLRNHPGLEQEVVRFLRSVRRQRCDLRAGGGSQEMQSSRMLEQAREINR